MKEKFYQKTWFVVLMLFLIFPLGLILMWVNKKFKPAIRVVLTVLFAFVWLLILASCRSDSQTSQTATEQTTVISNEQTEATTTTIEQTTVVTTVTTEQTTATVEQTETTTSKPNTSARVDEIARQAKADAKNIDTEKTIDAVKYIKENYPNYFTNNEVMEKTMYYGYLLEYGYKNKNNNYADLGMDAYQVVKYVYRGAEKVEDISTQENLKQIAKDLDKIK